MTENQIKAREFIIKFQFQNPPLDFETAKKCALISIYQILENNAELLDGIEYHQELNIWEEVKDEINNL
jgi:hypothetical protein